MKKYEKKAVSLTIVELSTLKTFDFNQMKPNASHSG